MSMYNFIYNPDGQGLEWTFNLPIFVLWNDAMHETRVVIEAQDWQVLVDNNVYRTWTEIGKAWLGYTDWSIEPNPEPEDNIEVATRYLAGTPAERDAVQRDSLKREIDSQVPQHSATDTLRDVGKEEDVKRYASAASERALELEETVDEDLDTFDPAISPADPQNPDAVYSRLTTSIIYLEPWAGAPNDDIGFSAVLEVETGDGSAGSEARILVVSGSDQGAVLPFAQDVSNLKLWSVQSRDGQKWSDPAQGTSLQLLWGAGSLPVSPTIVLDKLHDRRADYVRYGVASGQQTGPGTTWVATGKIVSFAQGNVIRTTDTSEFSVGMPIRVNTNEYIIETVHSSIDLLVSPNAHPSDVGGEIFKFV